MPTPPGELLSHARRIARPALAGPLATALAGGARVLLTAEAGYGKTALLDEALALVAGDAVRLCGRDLSAGDPRMGGALSAGAIVVLDDAGELRADARMVPQALLESPSAAAVVVAARGAPGLALGRLRAEGRLIELGAAELAFNARECEELLRTRLGRDPFVHEVERIMELTEGWPFGVALAAAGPGALLRADGEEALAFLREEVLDRVDPAVRETLLDAAVPARLDAAMARAVGLDLEAVTAIARLGVFLRPCDPEGAAYRFHPVFRTLLRRRAMAERPAERVAAVEARVAEAFASDGWSPDAFEHWLAAGDWRAALDAVEAAGPELVATGAERLERWRRRLPLDAAGTVAERLLEGAQACATGCPERAVAPLSAAVQGAREAGRDGAEWTARALLASALMALGEAEHAADAAHGFDGPAGWRAGLAAPAAAMSAAVALAGAGRAQESHALALAALRHPAGGALTGFEHLRQAQLDQPRGRLDSALARVRSALAALDGEDPLGQRPMLLTCAAALLAEQGLDDQALSTWGLVVGAAAARGDLRLIAAASAQRALLHARAGRLGEAELELGRAEREAETSGGAVYEAALAAVAALQGDPADALAAAERAVSLCAAGPLPARLSLAATLAPIVAYAGAPARADEIVTAALTAAEDCLGAGESGWAQARLLVQRASLASLRGDRDAADESVAAAWVAAATSDVHLMRREWPRLRWLVWGALERGRLEAEPVLRAIECAWPGGSALLPFTEHPLPAVRRRAVAPVIASGHPRALGQLKELATESDPAVAAAARAAIDSIRETPPPLIFRLLGGFEARRGTWRVDAAAWGRPMTARLVRFLLLHRGRVVPEDVIFEAFWPGKPAGSARRNLQVAISLARGVLDTGLADESIIEAVDRGYRLRLAEHDIVDAEEFETAARAALVEGDAAARRTLLQRAAALWGGEPLPEDTYADWSRDWRRALTDLYSGVLEALVEACREAGDARATIEAATKLLELDPLNEAVHRDLMAAYARSGRIADALKQYLKCRRLLVDELGVEPSAATSLMQGRILAGEFA